MVLNVSKQWASVRFSVLIKLEYKVSLKLTVIDISFSINTMLKHGAVYNPDISVITISAAGGEGDIVMLKVLTINVRGEVVLKLTPMLQGTNKYIFNRLNY